MSTKLFGAVKIERMQSNKASKKTRKDVSEPVSTASAEASAVSETTAKSRASKSSVSKSETIETASAKRHRKAATVNTQESAVQEPVPAPKTMAAAAGLGTTGSVVMQPIQEVPQQRIQELAYQFWLADGQPHGNHSEHWFRAERELGIAR
jgi:hypothetical protein